MTTLKQVLGVAREYAVGLDAVGDDGFVLALRDWAVANVVVHRVAVLFCPKETERLLEMIRAYEAVVVATSRLADGDVDAASEWLQFAQSIRPTR